MASFGFLADIDDFLTAVICKGVVYTHAHTHTRAHAKCLPTHTHTHTLLHTFGGVSVSVAVGEMAASWLLHEPFCSAALRRQHRVTRR